MKKIKQNSYQIDKNNLDIIKKWKKSLPEINNVKPLIIKGEKGVGKTSLANVLLEKYTTA